MANKTIYVRDEDAWLYERAVAGGEESISAVITRILRSYVTSKDARELEERKEQRVKERVEGILGRSVEMRGSDVHFEPFRGGGRVRVRVDGELLDMESIEEEMYEEILGYLMGEGFWESGDGYVHGRFEKEYGGELQEFRGCVLPTRLGRALTLRRLSMTVEVPDLGDLESGGEHLGDLRELVGLSHGLVVVTGPTGSGKTTTLYSMLKSLSGVKRKVMTVESPVEWCLEGCVQVPVGGAGMGFGAAIRGVLRSDPDVVMVGELRDVETARRCLEMALTGHLVFTVLHAETALGALQRMLDLGLEGYLLRDALRAVIAQKLVRRVCQQCRRESKARGPRGELGPFFRGDGCESCGGVGTRGRTLLMEVMKVGGDLKEALGRGEGLAAAVGEDFVDLYQDGLRKARQGELLLSSLPAPEAS